MSRTRPIPFAIGLMILIGVVVAPVVWIYTKRTNSINAIRCDVSLSDHKLVLLTNKDDDIKNLQMAIDTLEADGNEVVFATNGPIFGPGYTHLGLVARADEQLNPLNTKKGFGNFYLQPNGVFFFERGKPILLTTADYLARNKNDNLAFQSGPILVLNRQINDQFTANSNSVAYRGGIGVGPDGKLHLAVTRDKVNLHTFAKYFRDEIGCHSVLYLDGAITGWFTQSDKKNLDREYATVLAVVRISDDRK
jgi:uncharacterized protein YigE (DUF2233 family)